MIIYKITNKINGKIYIGQTTRSLDERWANHCANSSKIKYLSRAIKKYGKDNFLVKILETCITIEQLNQREIFYIKQFNSIAPNGYNLSFGGEAFFRGRHHSKKSKKQISDKMKMVDISHLFDSEVVQKRVSSFKKNGKLKGISRSQEVKTKISIKNSGKNHGMYGKRGFDCPNSKGLYCVELNKKFGSQMEAAKILNLQQANIHKVLSGQRKQTGGFTFRYLEENYGQ